MPFNTLYANNILNLVMGKTASMTGTSKVWLGLCSNDPEAGNGSFNELSGKGYTRVLLHQYNDSYPGLIGSADNRAIANVKQIGFTKATGGDWDDVNGYGLFTEPTGGAPFYYTKLKNTVSTPEGAVFLFDPGDLKIAFHTSDVDITE